MEQKTISVNKLIVTPGLIDIHTHVYWGGTSLGIDAEEFCRKSAVTTAVDTGSTGPGNFYGFRRHVIEKSAVKILAFLHISHAGIYAFSERVMVGESENLKMLDPISATEIIEANKDIIVGIKVRVGKNTSGNNGILPLEYALQVSEKTNLPIMVHIDEAPPEYGEVLKYMRKGDILTHCFRPSPNSPLGSNGEILPEVLDARERGVFFEIYNQYGYLPITTDSHLGEYLQWAYSVADHEAIIDFYDNYKRRCLSFYNDESSYNKFFDTKESKNQERIIPIIEAILNDSNVEESAVNVPNKNYISQVPNGIVVEVPGIINKEGIKGIKLNNYPSAFGELLNNQTGTIKLTTDAVLNKSRHSAYLAMLADPVVDNAQSAEKLLNAILQFQNEYLGYLK